MSHGIEGKHRESEGRLLVHRKDWTQEVLIPCVFILMVLHISGGPNVVPKHYRTDPGRAVAKASPCGNAIITNGSAMRRLSLEPVLFID